MLEWIEVCGLLAKEVVLSVLWDVKDGEERRERFAVSGGREKGKWRVVRVERKGEEGNLWERSGSVLLIWG
jgi:hypothetical protein